MSNIKRKMKWIAALWKDKEQMPKATRAMKFRCEKCGKEWWMWLQTGLEEPGEDYKPVPYIIMCKCGGIAHHADWHMDQHLQNEVPITKSMSYFANMPESDCGVPVLR